MKAITILQPWASLIACGAKQIETRSWATKYRGPIAIHAGKKLPSNDRQIIADTLYEKQQFNIPLGAVIAIAELIDCVKVIGFDDFANCPILDAKYWLLNDTREVAFGDFTVGRYAWILANIRRVEPVPAKGMQRLWEWEP